MINPVVHIVDDDEAIRDSIKELVESVGMTAALFESAPAVLEIVEPDSCGCIVLDIRMVEMSGLELQDRLLELGIEIPLIIITGHGDIDIAVTAIKKGALDFIQKPYHEQNLLDSINAAMLFDVKKKAKQQQQLQFKEYNSHLTQRETEVLDLLIKGMSNKLIARSLEISPRTVEVHRQHIFEKYDVHSAPQLIYLVNQSTV